MFFLSYSSQAVETIKSDTTSSLPTEHEKQETEQPPVGPSSITSAPSAGTHLSNGSKPHRHHMHAQPTTLSSAATSSSNASTVATESLHHNSSNYYVYTSSPSDLRLRQLSSSSSSHTASSSSVKDSPPSRRNDYTSQLSPTYSPESSSSKHSVTVVASSREKVTAVTKHAHATEVVTETDKLTGTFTVISPKQAEERPTSSNVDRKQAEKLDKINLKRVESPAQSTHSPQQVNIDSSATSATPPNQRRLKSSRRSGSKLQRSPQPPELKTTTPSPAVPPATPPVNQDPPHNKQDSFLRKESESSMKSTDSESTSSSEKPDEREDSEAIVPLEVVDSSKSKAPHPLAKEPNTGQTVPVTPVSDAPDLKSIGLDVHKKDKEDAAAPGGGGRGKGKKRLARQQLKREEKPKKKERERERDRERRERGVTKGHPKPERVSNIEEAELDKQRPASGESSSSNSTEQLYEEQNDQRAESQEADDEKSDVSSIPEKESSQKLESKTVERESPKPETPNSELGSPQKSDRPPRKTDDDDVSGHPSSVVPVAAVPSSAFKMGRGKSTVVKQRSEEGHSEHAHRSTKKSSSSKKMSDRSAKAHTDAIADKSKQAHHVPVEALPTEGNRREEDEEETLLNARPQTLPVIDVEVSEESILSPDSGSVETDGVQHKLGFAKAAQLIPTSPHELAASLLSNNSAIKRRSRQHGDMGGQNTDDGNDDGDYEEDDSEEGSDGDTHSANSPAMYQPTPKHPRMDSSPHSKSQGQPFHHPGSHHPSMSQRRIMMKPPSTLSLDAEPFYPTNFPSKSCQGRPRMVDQHKYPQDYTPEGSGGTLPSANVGAPPGFSSEDSAYMQQGPYPEKPFKQDYPVPPGRGPVASPGVRPRSIPAHRPKPGTPSPPSPTYNTVGDGQAFPYAEQHPGMEPPEHMPGFHTPPTVADVQMYDGTDEPVVYPPVGGGRRFSDQRRELAGGGGGGLDAHLVAKSGGRRVTPTGVGPYPEQYLASLHHQQQLRHQQQMGGAMYRPSRGERAPPSGFTVTGQRSLWENPNAYRLQPIPGGEDPALLHHQEYLRKRSILLKLYQQEQAALEAAVAREQAKRSAETLSALSQPYRSSRSAMLGGGKVDLSSPVGVPGENLWEAAGGANSVHEPAVSHQGFDDPGVSESILRQRQIQHYLANQPAARSRTYSGDSDIGGEFLSNPVQVPSSIGHPGLNRAPGPGTSEGRGQASSSGWPSRSRSEVSLFTIVCACNTLAYRKPRSCPPPHTHTDSPTPHHTHTLPKCILGFKIQQTVVPRLFSPWRFP